DAIPNEKDNSKWNALKTGAYSNYNNNVEANSIKKFGRLYNHYAVADKRNLAPTGWHVASDTEWSTLIDYVNNNLGSSNTIAQALTTKTDWTESSVDGAVGCLDLTTYTYVNNSSGFSGLPSGIRHNSGWFNAVGSYCCWWTSVAKDNSSVYFRSLSNYSTYTGRNVYDKNFGLSVRCVKD
ncbi:MAG: fibrobacter succinogenes major paralogous domain-containing protein, partial [Paludibacter sp.]